jgi:hypothetical protein
MPTFSVTINETIPVIDVSENLQNVTIQSTSSVITLSQNGIINTPVPGPTGPTGPTGSQGATGAQGATGPAAWNYQTFNRGSSTAKYQIDVFATNDILAPDDRTISAKYYIHIRDGQSFYITEYTIAYDSTNVYASEYGILTNNGTLGTFSIERSGNSIFVYYTPTSPTAMVIRVANTKMAAA